jgi:glycerol dehydrogenase-like iron-containing ADH family enzyme
MAIGMASAGVNAAGGWPSGSEIGVVANLSAGAGRIVDTFEAGYSARSAVYPTIASMDAFAGPYRLMVSTTDDQDLSKMILTSLGLMAMIAFRRRTI